MEYVISAIVGVALGAVFGLVFARRGRSELESRLAEQQRNAEAEAERLKKEAEIAGREQAVALTSEADAEAARRRQELTTREERLHKKEETIEKRSEQINRKDNQLAKREKELGRREKRVARQEDDLETTLAEARRQLERVAGISQEEARQQLVDEVREDARRKSIEEVIAVEAEARKLAEDRARMVVSAAIQRYAGEHVADRTVTVVNLPSDEMKGRIIGREGRNIRAFEAATGCDLIIDDTPEAVVVSGFNPVRREIAKIALEKLLTDGRIHPTRIEEVVSKATSEMEQVVRKHGEAATLELEVSNLHPVLVKHLGQLHFRQTFAQNVLRHSIEVGFLAGAIAAELGLNEKQARRAGLLHDIGKAIEQEVEGPHALVGAALARKHGEHKAVVHAIAAHHENEQPRSILAHIVGAANALSAGRPGARMETLAAFIKRLEDLEALVLEFDGVERCYAIQSGREVRVLVENAEVTDREAQLLCRDIARRVQDELTYPGDIKITVIRETRAVQYAR
ncbi:MAG: ribonuclease Y [Bradymonadia bacterium]